MLNSLVTNARFLRRSRTRYPLKDHNCSSTLYTKNEVLIVQLFGAGIAFAITLLLKSLIIQSFF